MSAAAPRMIACSKDLRAVAPQVNGPWFATSAAGTPTARWSSSSRKSTMTRPVLGS